MHDRASVSLLMVEGNEFIKKILSRIVPMINPIRTVGNLFFQANHAVSKGKTINPIFLV